MRISDWSSDVCSSDLSRLGSGRTPSSSRIGHVPVAKIALERGPETGERIDDLGPKACDPGRFPRDVEAGFDHHRGVERAGRLVEVDPDPIELAPRLRDGRPPLESKSGVWGTRVAVRVDR